jgi:hypothetical protein
MSQVILEPVDVIVKYKGTAVEIIKFRKGNTEYNVSKMGNSWKEPKGNGIITHYSLICDKQGICCELSHDHILNKWLLVQFDILN